MMSSAAEEVETAAEDSNTRKWTKEQTADLIRLRRDNEHLFTGAKHSAAVGWREIMEKMDLAGKISPVQAKRKWENLKRKYKVSTVECKYPATGEGASGKPTAATWPWFGAMDEVLGQRPSTRPPVLISSIQEDTPGPSAAVGNPLPHQEGQEDEEPPEARVAKRRRDGEDELIALIKEDMAQQRQMEERRAERMDRLIGVLEKLVEQKKD
ncbi:uncharacterized protein LOC109201910 [Oreochromis niloticus]|uniref:uncharacterized protein LOC109201910 n=1 Tax=Oreochromis niloticus TaxID=8128 RepID=UPI000DF37D23|nr:uncharacterized protein LOC109201910 [Oreochromis niloticus]